MATATDLADIGSALSAANSATSARIAALLPAAADEVSTALASLFAGYGRDFQALSAQAAAFHARFIQTLIDTGAAYAAAEAAAASPLQTFQQNLTALATNIFGSPPRVISASEGAIFTGTPSLS